MRDKQNISEDDEPLYDIESDWKFFEPLSRNSMLVFRHKDNEEVYRLIDAANQKIHFADAERVTTERIIDINKPLPDIVKAGFLDIVDGIINYLRPISMPYIPEKITVYVETIDNYLGVLYYKVPPKAVIAIKKFFKKVNGKYEEISFMEYQEYKERMEEK